MSARRNFEWPELLTADGRGIAFGGDYNPDQWSEDIWDDDIRLMKQAGVNTVAVAIFSWDRIQPEENRWDFGWLDRIIGKAGIAVDLASATATAPLWLYEKHPEVLPQDKFGHPVNAGSRQSWSPTSPVFKEYALTLCRKLAERYGMECWTNIESFDRDMPIKFLPIKWEKLRLKMGLAAQAGYQNAITFEFSHFMSPQSAYLQAGHLYDRYMEYLKTLE